MFCDSLFDHTSELLPGYNHFLNKTHYKTNKSGSLDTHSIQDFKYITNRLLLIRLCLTYIMSSETTFIMYIQTTSCKPLRV